MKAAETPAAQPIDTKSRCSRWEPSEPSMPSRLSSRPHEPLRGAKDRRSDRQTGRQTGRKAERQAANKEWHYCLRQAARF
eukprot:SAG22_NODE_1138_length_5389_cov_22.995085_2_plen_80_part_00